MSTQPMVKITGVGGGLDSANLDDENNLVPVQLPPPDTVHDAKTGTEPIRCSITSNMINKYFYQLN